MVRGVTSGYLVMLEMMVRQDSKEQREEQDFVGAEVKYIPKCINIKIKDPNYLHISIWYVWELVRDMTSQTMWSGKVIKRIVL